MMVPVVAPVGTATVICVAEFTVKLAAATLLNDTALDPVKFVPVITTDVPIGPLVGLNEVIVGIGGTVTVKLEALVAVPPGTVTRTSPDVAPDGTIAVICADEFTV